MWRMVIGPGKNVVSQMKFHDKEYGYASKSNFFKTSMKFKFFSILELLEIIRYAFNIETNIAQQQLD